MADRAWDERSHTGPFSNREAELDRSLGTPFEKNPDGMVSDELLIHDILSGDEASFEVLFGRYHDKVFSICLRYSRGNHSQAQDLCQETYINGFLALKELKDPSLFSHWLGEIAKNQCLKFQRKQKTLKKYLKEYVGLREAITSPDQRWSQSEIDLIDAVLHEFAKIEIIDTAKLYYFEGKKTNEIAEIQKISLTTVTTRLNRFRAKLRSRVLQEILKKRNQSL